MKSDKRIPCSSIGQSNRLLTGGLQVRILPGEQKQTMGISVVRYRASFGSQRPQVRILHSQQTYQRVSYNGYYSFLPSRRRGFDSSHPLKMASRISVITSGFGPDKWGSIPWEPTNIGIQLSWQSVDLIRQMSQVRVLLFLQMRVQ